MAAGRECDLAVIKLALQTVGNRVVMVMLVPDQPELRTNNHRQQQCCQRSGGAMSMELPDHNAAEHTLFVLRVTRCAARNTQSTEYVTARAMRSRALAAVLHSPAE